MPLDRSLGLIKYSYRDFLRFLWSRIRPYQGRFWAATFFRLTGDIVWLYPAYAIARIVTILGGPLHGQFPHEIVMIGSWWAVAIVWRTGAMYAAKYFGFGVAARASIDTQRLATAHLYQLDMAWQQREGAGNKMKRIDRGAMAVSQTIRMWFSMALEIVVNLFGMIFIIFKITTGLGLALIVFVIIFMILSTIMTRYASSMEMIVDQKEEEIQGLTFEGINNIRTVKMLDLGPTLLRRLEHELADMMGKIQIRIGRFQDRSTVMNSWGQLFRFVSLFVIIAGIVHGTYSLGFLILFQSYFNRLWESVNELSEMAPDIVTAKYAVARVAHILQEPVRIESSVGKVTFPTEWQTIMVDHLSFSYESTPVLQDISFTVRRGERIGIIGLSGAGKSTLFKVLMKEYEATSGMVRFDQLDLTTIDRGAYLRAMAAVLQETEVFNFSLRDNVTMARPGGTEAELATALEVSHVQDFIYKLPHGLETLIGEKGFRLSGGEKQRVGLARAIYKQPQLLLLDEATSHLDLESEKKIQDSLHHVFQSVTAIVIAHRLTTIMEMDRILVIENGRLIEAGTFNELQQQRGRFYELWEKQRL